MKQHITSTNIIFSGTWHSKHLPTHAGSNVPTIRNWCLARGFFEPNCFRCSSKLFLGWPKFATMFIDSWYSWWPSSNFCQFISAFFIFFWIRSPVQSWFLVFWSQSQLSNSPVPTKPGGKSATPLVWSAAAKDSSPWALPAVVKTTWNSQVSVMSCGNGAEKLWNQSKCM